LDLNDGNVAHWTAFGVIVCPGAGEASGDDGDPVECELVEGEMVPISMGSPARAYCEAREFRCKTCGLHALVVKREIREQPDELLQP